MKESEIDIEVANYKTICCNANWEVKERLYYVCSECNKDVTMEIIYLTDALMKNVDEKENKSDFSFLNQFKNLFKGFPLIKLFSINKK